MINENTMLFYTGESNGYKYYYARHYLAEDKFFSMFKYDSGRDFNFRGGKWK